MVNVLQSYLHCKEIAVRNSVDPYQMSHRAVSDWVCSVSPKQVSILKGLNILCHSGGGGVCVCVWGGSSYSQINPVSSIYKCITHIHTHTNLTSAGKMWNSKELLTIFQQRKKSSSTLE